MSINSSICKPFLGREFKNIVQSNLTHWRFEPFDVSGNNFKTFQNFILATIISLTFTNFYNKTFYGFLRVIDDTAKVQLHGARQCQDIFQCNMMRNKNHSFVWVLSMYHPLRIFRNLYMVTSHSSNLYCHQLPKSIFYELEFEVRSTKDRVGFIRFA